MAEVETPPRLTTFIVNPKAAAGRTGRRWAGREALLRPHFPLGEVQFTHGPGDAAGLAREAGARGQQLVVAVGGDGTVHEVVQGLMALPEDERPRLGIWPAGSGSDFARGQGISSEPAEALQRLVANQARRVDVGRVHFHDAEGSERSAYFLNSVDFGIGAAICRRLQQRRRFWPGRPSYLWSTVRALMHYRNPSVQLQIDDGQERELRIKCVVVANGAYFGSGMCIAPDAKADDGLFEVVTFGDLGRIEAMHRLGETYSGSRVLHPRIEYARARTVEARSEKEVLLEADGEFLGMLPARIEILPRVLGLV